MREEIFLSNYYFLDNRKGMSRLLYVLAGYKPKLWKNVFERIKTFCPSNVDICIVTSGVYSEEINIICSKNEWSYLSTDINKLTIAQNIVIRLFDNADLIFKMDEDVFVTQGFWEALEFTYTRYEKKYRVGFVGPLMPIHNYGFHKYIEKKELNEAWKKFAPQFANDLIGGHNKSENPALYSDELADFLWDQCNQIDKEAYYFKQKEYEPEIVNMRFPICAIMFKRDLWKKIDGFDIGDGNGGGIDEIQIHEFCARNSYFNICDLKTLCYHFGFAYQEHISYRKYRVFADKYKLIVVN